MTKVYLYKLSAPGWTKEYDSDADLKTALYTHICNDCRKGCIEEETIIWNPVDENSSVYDMLNTACGCEFDIGGEEDRESHYAESETDE
jgi:transcription elongation factor Elf1